MRTINDHKEMEFPEKELFRAWLQTHPAEEVISENWDHCDCPLARWLNDIGITKSARIEPCDDGSPSFWKATPYGYDYPLPVWAEKFGTAIDRLNFDVPATTEDCLAILDAE